MKKIFTLLFLVLLLIALPSSTTNAQLQRNVLLEYCTGTWCQYCPCGHATIRDNIMPMFPNTVVVGYHGPANTSSEPFSFYSGNTIISTLGFGGYPTAFFDRALGSPQTYPSWFNSVSIRNSVNATVTISILKTYDTTSRQLNLTVIGTALANLSGSYNVNVILTQSNLKYSQTGNTGCIGGGPEYRHEHVVRSMLNGPLGDLINTGGVWNQNEILQKVYSFTIPSDVNGIPVIPANSHIVVFIYKQASPLNSGVVQQAEEWTLLGDIVPVEFSSFTGALDGKGILLNWSTATEKNNYGFTVERSVDGINYASIGFVNGNGTTTEKQNYSFKDNPESAGIFYYRLRQQDFDGSFSFSDVIAVKLEQPLEFSLGQNYPNPFNPATLIAYSIPVESFVTLSVYDLMGREVAKLVSEVKKPGRYDVEFNAVDLASGTYIYKITAGSFIESRKLMVLK